tara:strand:- start:116 stop:415 length:300 start_codon:yes stop_codon:yes gene_type:complete
MCPLFSAESTIIEFSKKHFCNKLFDSIKKTITVRELIRIINYLDTENIEFTAQDKNISKKELNFVTQEKTGRRIIKYNIPKQCKPPSFITKNVFISIKC